MNSNEDGAVVALQGRVPVKVLGKVQKGDMMVTCGTTPGYAMVARYFIGGAVIGKALEDKLDGERGTVEVVVGKH